ncbi:MAG: PDZ domain-containing protein, partial [Planctomycetes bacterium]|nr:PDZ domain-containing protein [Planctomycetota bacterium]
MRIPCLPFVGAIALGIIFSVVGFTEAPAKDKVKPKKDAVESASANLDKLFAWRSIGPANMGGRITSLAVFEADPTCYYAATASGGLLKTINNGSTFTHQFDKEATVSLGAVAVAPSNRDIVWAGAGEANPRNSVSWGDGVYKSTDGGKAWKNMGLKSTFQIGKIVIHPKNSDVVYVAALGRLYGPNEERGLFKTTDGGKSWQRVWFHDDKTGALELVMDPNNPETLLLASWERQRDEFDTFVGDAKPPPAADAYAPVKTHAPGSGLYKSLDGGKTWKKLTQGLPSANLGRVGLDWSRKNPNLVIAIIDTEKAGTGMAPAKGYFGVAVENSSQGVRITNLPEKSPAVTAKLAKGDILRAINGKEFNKIPGYLLALQPFNPGDKIMVSYERNKNRETVEVTLSDWPGDEKKKKNPNRGTLGIQVDESDDGIVLTELVPNGPADKARLKIGDVLLALDGTKIDAIPTLFKKLAAKKIGDTVKVVVQRGPQKKEFDVVLAAAPLGTPERPFSGGFLAGQRANVQDYQGPGGDHTGGIYKSLDGGDSWTRINSLNERPFYFSVVRCDPNDVNTVYALGIDLFRSSDGGRTFSAEGINAGVHS